MVQDEANNLYQTLIDSVLEAKKRNRPLDFDTPGKNKDKSWLLHALQIP